MTITITHNRATFTVKPENAEPTRELLALIDKSKGRKGRKLPKDKGQAKHDSSKRQYPMFYPGMRTADYISQYNSLNRYLFGGAYAEDKILSYTHADRPAAMLDPSIPEVTEEPCEQ
jgi:hypothetical protein